MAGKVTVPSEEATAVALLTGHDMAVKLSSMFMTVDQCCQLQPEKLLLAVASSNCRDTQLIKCLE